MLLGIMVGLGPGNIVVDGDTAPPPQKREQSPQFSAHVCCGQTAGRTKMPLGREVGLGPGHVVLDGDASLPHKKGHSSPLIFRPMPIVAKRLDGSRCHMVRR